MSYYVAGAIVVGAIVGSESSKKASKTQAETADKNRIANQEQFDKLETQLDPFRETGEIANQQINQLLSGDRSGFQQDPGYQFQLEQGEQSINRLASQQGRLNTGAQAKGLARFNQGLASQSYNDYVNRLLVISGRGQAAVNSGGQFGQNFQQQQSNFATQGANARASNYINQGNIANNALNQYVQYSQFQQQAPQQNYPQGSGPLVNRTYN